MMSFPDSSPCNINVSKSSYSSSEAATADCGHVEISASVCAWCAPIRFVLQPVAYDVLGQKYRVLEFPLSLRLVLRQGTC